MQEQIGLKTQNYFKCRHKKDNYFDGHISVKTAVVYQCNESVLCVSSLSDNTDHKNAAVWASLILKAMLNKIS